MNIEAIPKSFWHAASFALIAFTLGFLFISYKYGDLTLKFNQLEVRTSNTVVLENNLKIQEELINKREKEIVALQSLLDSRAKELLSVKQELANLQETLATEEAKQIVSKIDAISGSNKFNEDYENKRNSLISLQQQQQQQQQIFSNQRNIFQKQLLKQGVVLDTKKPKP